MRRPRSRRAPLGRISAALLVLLLAGCAGKGERGVSKEPWNVLLITFDTTRADRIGSYGNARIETPRLDGLAAEGVRFAQAMAAVPITAPSHSSILTGRYPIAHGVRDNGLFVLADDQLTLAEILRREGYATAAAVGAYPVTEQFGFSQGFDLFDDHLTGVFEDYLGHRVVPKERLFFDERRAAQVNEAVLPWIDAHADGPFFTWVHYFDPHQPFEPPPPYDQLYADDLYNGEIAYADSRVGFLLDHLESLGVLDRTLVVMTADHGEGLGEHNELTHAVLAYNSTLHVPLIIRPPRGAAPPGTVVDTRVTTVDIAATILDLLGIEAPDTFQGRSLAPLWGEQAGSPPTTTYAENISSRLTHGWGELRVLYDGPYKYIHGPRPELFDLETDPGEMDNLAASRPEDVVRLRDTLRGFLKTHAVAGVSAPEEIADDVRRRLESLGYLQGGGSVDQGITETLRTDGIAPQDRVGDINDLSSAKHLLFMGRQVEALVYTERLTRANPTSPLYLELHANALALSGRLDEARRTADRLGEVAEVPQALILQLAAQTFESGDERRAIEGLRQRIAARPEARPAWLLASFHKRLGERDAAREALETALRADPGFAAARVDLAVLLAEDGDSEAAEDAFRVALDDSPYAPRAFYNFGVFLYQRGRLDEATAALERAVALAPGYGKAYLALVAVHLAADRRTRAEEVYAVLRRLAPRDEAAAAAELLAAP